MRYRKLGNSALEVSEIGLGSWLTFSGGIERKRSETCLREALELGINFIDTANAYGRGASEEFLGQTLEEVPRDSFLIATKVFYPMSPEDRGLSRVQIFKQIDGSLKRLRVERIDLYQCHRYDPETPLAETMAALTEVVRCGKARYIGFSEWTAEQIRQARALPGVERFVSSQPQYSMLWRAPEKEVIPLCREQGIGQVVWSPLAQGLLTGKYRPGQPPPNDSRAANPAMNSFLGPERRPEALLAAIQQLRPIAAEAGLTLSQLALAWVLRDPSVSSAIIGATRPEQIRENAAASGRPLDPELLTRIDAVLKPVLPAG